MIDKQQEIFEVDCLMVDRSAIRCDRVPSLLLNFFPDAQHSVTVFENHRKSLIQHCERSELRLHFEKKNGHFGEFLKT